MLKLVVLFTLVLLLSGCVRVAEPVGDIAKAEPDKNLFGSWTEAGGSNKVVLKIEPAPEVKGNPKGLMRMYVPETKNLLGTKNEVPIWFFVTTVGKKTYWNVCLDPSLTADFAAFETEGAYAKWAKGPGRMYLVFRCDVTKDGLVVNHGDERTFNEMMRAEKIDDGGEPQGSFGRGFKTPAGWLAKYLEKNGSDRLFPAEKDSKYTKMK